MPAHAAFRNDNLDCGFAEMWRRNIDPSRKRYWIVCLMGWKIYLGEGGHREDWWRNTSGPCACWDRLILHCKISISKFSIRRLSNFSLIRYGYLANLFVKKPQDMFVLYTLAIASTSQPFSKLQGNKKPAYTAFNSAGTLYFSLESGRLEIIG